MERTDSAVGRVVVNSQTTLLHVTGVKARLLGQVVGVEGASRRVLTGTGEGEV